MEDRVRPVSSSFVSHQLLTFLQTKRCVTIVEQERQSFTRNKSVSLLPPSTRRADNVRRTASSRGRLRNCLRSTVDTMSTLSGFSSPGQSPPVRLSPSSDSLVRRMFSARVKIVLFSTCERRLRRMSLTLPSFWSDVSSSPLDQITILTASLTVDGTW